MSAAALPWVIGGLGIISTGYGIYASERAYDRAKGIEAPKPGNYYVYDEEGNVESAQIWNEEKGGYEVFQNPEPLEPKYTPTKDEMMGHLRGKVKMREEDEFGWEEMRRTIYSYELEDGTVVEADSYNALLKDERIVDEVSGAVREGNEEYQEEYKKWEKEHAEWLEATEQRKEDREKREALRRQMLDNLSETPEDRVKAYEEYGRVFAQTMREEAIPAIEEYMEKRGMTGSSAHGEAVGETEANIARTSALAKEDLKMRDMNYWLTVLGATEGAGRADEALAIQKAGLVQQGAHQATAPLMAKYATELRKAELGMQRAGNIMDTSTGLMFLYGLYGNRGTTKEKTKVDSSLIP